MKLERSRRWWIFFCVGVLTTIALLGLVGIIVANIVIVSQTGTVKYLVQTPMGTDFFTVQFGMSSGASGAYVIPVTVGKDKETVVDTLLDSGSPDTWFDANTGFTSVSSTYRAKQSQTYALSYLGGSVSGHLASDLLSANGFGWNQTLAVITKETMSMGHIHGIMGLSRGGCDARGLCSLVNWPLNQSVLGFYYDPSSWVGVFMAGYVDEERYCAPGSALTYLPQTGDYFWSGAVGMRFNDEDIGSDLEAVFDTGTTYFMMSPEIAAKVESILKATGCSQPTISLRISGKWFTIPSNILVTDYSTCALRTGVVSNTAVTKDLLVGAAFLVNFYTVFDIANERMGFCQAKRNLYRSRRLQDESGAISSLLDDPGRRNRYSVKTNT